MKKITAGGVAAAAAFALSSYFSPHFTLYQMKRAIDNRDADAFSDHVDFPALRENFKGQMMAYMNQQMASPEMKNNPFAGLGQVLATAFMGPMIDSMVSPAGVIAMMNTGKPVSPKDAKNSSTQSPPEKHERPNYSISYKSWGRAVVRADEADAKGMGFVLKRDGLWSWKLAGVELPEQFATKP